MDVLSASGGLLLRIARSLSGIEHVRWPLGIVCRDLSSGPVRFGPFTPGQKVRVQASANAWVLVGSGAVECSGDGEGIPLAAWDRQDWTVPDEADSAYVSIRLDSGGVAGYGVAWPSAFGER